MDKNYNVDDILSEIKMRKSRDRGISAAPVSSEAAGQEDTQQDAAPVRQDIRERAQEPDVGIRSRFDFMPNSADSYDAPGAPTAPKKNPLDFDGHVRPITDKAKLRTKATPPQGQQKLNGFAFNADAENQKKSRFFTKEHTRELPKFPTSRELSVDDIRRMNIGARARDAADDVYYNEEDYLTDNMPAGSSVDFSEYNNAADRKAVATDIARVKLWLFLRASATALLTAALLYLSFAGGYVMPLPGAIVPAGETIRAYLITCTVGAVLVALVNSAAVGGGLLSLFKMRANSDSMAALSILAAIGQGVAGCLSVQRIDPASMNLFFPIAALAMLFNALGKLTMINRIQQNFKIIGSDSEKHALLAVDNPQFCSEFAGGAGGRRPTIGYTVRAGFFTDFLALSYSDKYDVGINRAVAPVCFIGAAIVSISTYILTGSAMAAFTALSGILCVCATFSATFIENIPLGKLTKKLAPQGGMVSGNKAVEDFCDMQSLVLSENDLFPAGHVQLHGIKSYAKGRVDEAIIDAASVLCAVQGSMSPVFLQMIGGNKKLLRKVDNIVYENGMGISAWVDSRRVLIGNRDMMRNHGVELPPSSQKAQQIGESETLFLASSGEITARFLVAYQIDDELAAQLDMLAARDVGLIVYTSDANITAQKLWELYAYPMELITILPAEWHGAYREMSAPRERAVAEIVYKGRASTLVKCILACIAARSSILSATAVLLVQIVLGYGIVAFMSFMGVIGSLGVIELLIYQGFWFVAILVIQSVRHS